MGLWQLHPLQTALISLLRSKKGENMAYFSSGDDRDKLMILYSLRCCGMPVSREQLVTIMAENGAENYFDISERLVELEQNGYIASVPTYLLQMIVLTSRGEEALTLFEKNLPKSLRAALENYIDSHLRDFHRENTSRTISTPLPDGGFDTTFALVENGDAIFEVRLKLPSIRYARIAERNWDSISEELYLSTLLRLTRDESTADKR